MNFIASIATVATGPLARREATMPAAISIWLSSQPPKLWPLTARSGTINPARRVTERTAMTLAAVLRDKGSAIETVAADTIMFDAVRVLGEKRIGALPVLEGGQIAGIISERDVIYCLREHG